MRQADTVGDHVDEWPSSLLEALQGPMRANPLAEALYIPGGPGVSYGQLEYLTGRAAGQLTDLGIAPGDRLLVAVSSDIAGSVLLLSAAGTASCCPVNPALAEAEFAAVWQALRPAALIAGQHEAPRLCQFALAQGLPVLQVAQAADDLTLQPLPGSARITPGRPRRAADNGLLLRTSGTTAVGKIVALSTRNIVAAAAATVAAYQLTPADQRLNIMPLFHVQGLVGSVVAALLAGSSVALLPAFEAAKTLRCLAECEPTWYSATPTMHRLLLEQLARTPVRTPSLRFIRCGSAALDSPLRRELEDAFGVPVVESYGMSEAHQIASTPLRPGQHAQGLLPTGSRVAILASGGRITTEPGRPGEIVISGANVAEKYLFPAEANRSAFVAGWFRTGDLGRLAADGSLLITGRLKELISRGGEKISPYEVEQALLSHPDVTQAAAFGVADPLLTERVAAAVVLRRGATTTEPELQAHIAGRLSHFKIPQRIVRQDALPVNATGKVVRSELARLLGPQVTQSAPPRPAPAAGRRPRTAMEAAVAGVWAAALQRENIGTSDDFFALGGDSLAAATVLTGIEELFGVMLSPVALFDEVNTVAKLAAAISGQLGEGRS